MVQFIKQEAEEKANEIRVAAEEVRHRSRPHPMPNTLLGTQLRKKCDLKVKTDASTCLCSASLSARPPRVGAKRPAQGASSLSVHESE